jgi:hypothetical protein
MGRRKAPMSLGRILSRDQGMIQQEDGVWRSGDLEMIETTLQRQTEGSGMMSSFHGSDESEVTFNVEDTEGRLFRDPDMVDLPNLKSKSKVAVPVSLADAGASTHSSRSRTNSREDTGF